MFGSQDGAQDLDASVGDQDLAGLEWIDPADWEPHPDLDGSCDDWDDALRRMVLEAIAESDSVAANPLLRLDDRELVDLAGQAERDLRATTALGYQVAAELARRRPDPSQRKDEEGLSAYALDELALATGLARGVVCARLAEADALTGRHRRLLAALAAGLLPLPAVRRVLDLTAVLSTGQCAQVETRLLDRLGHTDRLPLGSMTDAELCALPTTTAIGVSTRANTARVAKIVKDLVHRIDSDATAKRETRAKSLRGIRVEPGHNGMSWLGLHVPEAAAWATYERLTDLALTIPDHPDDQRTLDAKRADVALELLLTAPADAPLVPVNLHVILDHTSCDLTSPSHGGPPGQAGRLGAITAETIRDLLDLAESTTGATHGDHAVPQSCPGQATHDTQGPGPYRPSDRLRNAMQGRDRACRFAGCNRPARPCELDHTLRHPDGPTCSCNLGHLCVHHHHLKHRAPGWTLTNHGNGHFTWTTPTGHTHDITPEREPPHHPDPDPP